MKSLKVIFLRTTLVLLFFVDRASSANTAKGYVTPPFGCQDAFPVKIGCFHGVTNGERLLKTLLFTDRDKSSKVYSGTSIDWKNWKSYVNGFLCRCAEEAQKKGYEVIGLQYYGECWSGRPTKNVNDKKSTKCIQNYFQKCDKADKHFACVGEEWTNYIYKVLPPPSGGPTFIASYCLVCS